MRSVDISVQILFSILCNYNLIIHTSPSYHGTPQKHPNTFCVALSQDFSNFSGISASDNASYGFMLALFISNGKPPSPLNYTAPAIISTALYLHSVPFISAALTAYPSNFPALHYGLHRPLTVFQVVMAILGHDFSYYL